MHRNLLAEGFKLGFVSGRFEPDDNADLAGAGRNLPWT